MEQGPVVFPQDQFFVTGRYVGGGDFGELGAQ